MKKALIVAAVFIILICGLAFFGCDTGKGRLSKDGSQHLEFELKMLRDSIDQASYSDPAEKDDHMVTDYKMDQLLQKLLKAYIDEGEYQKAEAVAMSRITGKDGMREYLSLRKGKWSWINLPDMIEQLPKKTNRTQYEHAALASGYATYALWYLELAEAYDGMHDSKRAQEAREKGEKAARLGTELKQQKTY